MRAATLPRLLTSTPSHTRLSGGDSGDDDVDGATTGTAGEATEEMGVVAEEVVVGCVTSGEWKEEDEVGVARGRKRWKESCWRERRLVRRAAEGRVRDSNITNSREQERKEVVLIAMTSCRRSER